MVLSLNSHRIEPYKTHPNMVISIRECLRNTSMTFSSTQYARVEFQSIFRKSEFKPIFDLFQNDSRFPPSAVLAVLDLEIPCSRPQTSSYHFRSKRSKHKGRDQGPPNVEHSPISKTLVKQKLPKTSNIIVNQNDQLVSNFYHFVMRRL